MWKHVLILYNMKHLFWCWLLFCSVFISKSSSNTELSSSAGSLSPVLPGMQVSMLCRPQPRTEDSGLGLGLGKWHNQKPSGPISRFPDKGALFSRGSGETDRGLEFSSSHLAVLRGKFPEVKDNVRRKRSCKLQERRALFGRLSTCSVHHAQSHVFLGIHSYLNP